MIECLDVQIDLQNDDVVMNAMHLSDDVICIKVQQTPRYGQTVKITLNKEQLTKLAEVILQHL